RSALTKTGMFVGSLDYAAPEQIRGEAADARTDVYSLGCVLFQAVAGELPYDRDSDVAKMYAHVNEPPPSLLAARADAPPGRDADTLTVLDSATNKRLATVDAGANPDGVVAGKGVAWLADAGADTVQRIQASDPPVPVAQIRVGGDPEGISLGKQLVWVANRA